MPIVIASYTLFCIIISFPSVLFGILFWELLKSIWNTIKSKRKINLENLQLADGALREAIWEEYKEHTLTLINETEHDIRSCYVLLDEVAWKNFEGKWEVKAKEVFDRPFKWNRDAKLDGKLDIESGNRASFVFISHYQYSVYNATKKQNEVSTDFDFVFFGDQHFNIGYGPNIRMRISIRGKLENEEYINPITYLLYANLKQAHGIPKVDIVKRRRISK